MGLAGERVYSSRITPPMGWERQVKHRRLGASPLDDFPTCCYYFVRVQPPAESRGCGVR